jgi:hypothetical protein
VLLSLSAEVSDVCDGVGLVPALALRDPAKALESGPGATAEDDCVVHDLNCQAVARLHAEPPPRLARHDDLVLGADLDA